MLDNEITMQIQLEIERLKHADTQHEKSILSLENWRGDATHAFEVLGKDIVELRAKIAQTATKSDIAGLQVNIEKAINGLLGDALNAIPGKQAAMWGGVVAVATIAIVIISLLR